MSQRKDMFYITREEKQTRIRVTRGDYDVIKAYAASHGRTLTAELHYLVFEASHCRLDDHPAQIKRLEDQLDQVIAIAQQYKKRYDPLK